MREIEARQAQHDPLGLTDELRQALAAPALDEFDGNGQKAVPGEGAAASAFELAVALGKCRLFGVEAGEDLDGTLPPDLAAAAAGEAARLAGRDAADAVVLGPAFDDAETEAEQLDLACGLLESRMDLWAAALAIGEAYLDAAFSAPAREREAVGQAAGSLTEAIARLDGRLLAQKPILSVAAGTELLNNWRSALAGPWRDAPPWWLDGSLEQAAEAVARQCRQWVTPGLATELPSAATAPERDFMLPAGAIALLGTPLGAVLPAGPPSKLTPVRHPLWAPPLTATAQMVAAQDLPSRPARVAKRWESPDHSLHARLALPRAVAGDRQTFKLSFTSAGGEWAHELQGTTASLAGIEAVIGPDAQMVFTWQQLKDVPDELILIVGGQTWPALPDEEQPV